MFNFAKKKIIENRENDDLLYEFVLTEIENKIIIKSLWAKAIAISEGIESKIEPLYMQYRVRNIKDQFIKLDIAFNDLKREALYSKIKSIFHNDEPNISIDSDSYTVVNNTHENEINEFAYEERRIKELEKAIGSSRKTQGIEKNISNIERRIDRKKDKHRFDGLSQDEKDNLMQDELDQWFKSN
ncbi:hypothetical protein N9A28_03510 [Sulfurimonas sp.]|nr:hypothetical protein [Sulfurimonas sp.]